MANKKTIAELFKKRPWQWGLRGDPYLWDEMQAHFKETLLPSTVNELCVAIEGAFKTLTKHSVSTPEIFYVERFSHGGMSSGLISPEFWRDEAIPLLLARFSQEK